MLTKLSDIVLDAKQILARTPQVLRALLLGLDESLLSLRKSKNGFTPSEVVGHLIANEEINFIPRMNNILAEDPSKEFPNLDREYTERGFDKSLSLEKRLDLFDNLRKKNLETLETTVSLSDLNKKRIHPYMGEITLSNLLSYWVVHDLTHLFQIIEILGLRYKGEVGPWGDFLKILKIPDGLARTGLEP